MLKRASQDDPAPTEGLGAIFPSMVYLQIALKKLGRLRTDPVIQRAEKDLDDFFLIRENGESIKIQPCLSPVWDTGIALYSLTEAGLDQTDPSVRAAADWLLSKECRFRGDWSEKVQATEEMSSWFFEYANAWYPDVDDTAMVSMALHRSGGKANHEAGRRGVEWMLAMQNDDGDGRPSTRPLIDRSWSMSRSPTTTPCRIPPALTSPAESSNACPGSISRSRIRPSSGRSTM